MEHYTNAVRYIFEAHEKGYHITREGVVIAPRGRVLSLSLDYDGYPKFGFAVNGCSYPIRAHRLQAYQKFGEAAFATGTVVRHLNGDKTDASWDNIDIGTYRQNTADICKTRLGKAIRAGRFKRSLPSYPSQHHTLKIS